MSRVLLAAGGRLSPGTGAIIAWWGNSRVVGDASTYPAFPGDGMRATEREALPGAEHTGSVTDPRGYKHEGHSGFEFASILTHLEDLVTEGIFTHAIGLMSINDLRVPNHPWQIREDAIIDYNVLLASPQVPKLLLIRETFLGLPGGLSDAAAHGVLARVRGFRAWQVNRVRELYVAEPRLSVVDPGWVYADLAVDLLHLSDGGHVKGGTAAAAAVLAHPGAEPAVKAAQQAALISARGSHLKHALDGRDQPTEVGDPGLVSSTSAFVGGRTWDMATALLQPIWTGCGFQSDRGDPGRFCRLVASGTIFPAATVADAYTICVARHLQAAPSTGNITADARIVCVGNAGTHAILYQSDTRMLLQVYDGANYVILGVAYAYQKAIETITWSHEAGAIEDNTKYTCRINGADMGAVALDTGLTPLVGVTIDSQILMQEYLGVFYGDTFGTVECVLTDDEGAAAITALELFANQVSEPSP